MNKFKESDVIVTDAGSDVVTYELAFKSFNWEEMTDWWESVLGQEEWEELSAKLPDNIWRLSTNDTQPLIEKLLCEFDWLPQKVNVLTARAVFNEDYKWVKLLTLNCPAFFPLFNSCFSQFEAEAIRLGVTMWLELNDENLVIVNDNQEAVLRIQYSDIDDWGKNDDWGENYYDIRTQSAMDLTKLKILDATQLCSRGRQVDS